MAADQTLLGQGVDLMVFGMGTVFVFLASLVLLTQAMSAILLRFSPQLAPSQAAASSKDIPPETVAAITAAVTRYRNERSPKSKGGVK